MRRLKMIDLFSFGCFFVERSKLGIVLEFFFFFSYWTILIARSFFFIWIEKKIACLVRVFLKIRRKMNMNTKTFCYTFEERIVEKFKNEGWSEKFCIFQFDHVIIFQRLCVLYLLSLSRVTRFKLVLGGKDFKNLRILLFFTLAERIKKIYFQFLLLSISSI